MAVYQVLWCFLLLSVTIEAKSIKVADGQPFQLNEYLLGTFSTRSFNGTWFSEDSFLHRNTAGDYVLFDLNNKNSTQFLARTVLDDYPGASITISPDRLYILIRYSVNAVFRHSTTALYAIYDIENNEYHDIAGQNQTQLALWTPVGHGLVYVYENNIYYLANSSAVPLSITTDGVDKTIYNGVPDWVYEEEVLGTGSALWFSPDGQKIAFASFNDTEVVEFEYYLYGTPGELDSQYPERAIIRYPKVGTPNPVVKTSIAILDTGEVTEIKAIPDRFLPDDYVLYEMTWVTDNQVAVISTNRVQNKGELVKCGLDGSCTQEATYEQENGWLDLHIPKYNKAGSQRIEILPQPEGDDFFRHIVLTDETPGNPETPRRLTQGRFQVSSVYGWDEVNNLIYFAGTVVNEPSQQQVYVVNIQNNETRCLTCEMETSRGLCKVGGAIFNKDFSRLVKVCQGPGPYLVEIHNVRNESEILVWEDNKALIDRLAVKSLPVIKNMEVPIADGFKARVRLLLPPGLDEKSAKKYPAVVNVYGGPDYNQISDAYSSGFQNYIVTNREYIYIYIDGRGSGKDGLNKTFQVYRRLGTVEIEDQIAVTKFLHQNLGYIDASNTGIWGWSYGGFSTAWALVKDKENVFKFGLSVAPVTSFIYYDSIYTERYMGLPTEDDNLGGYNGTDVTRNVEAMRGKLFLLIHGSGDDNVHYQQSMLLAKALEQADISFRQQSYPDENHSLTGVSPHLYHTIDRFWARSFNRPDPPAPRIIKDKEKN